MFCWTIYSVVVMFLLYIILTSTHAKNGSGKVYVYLNLEANSMCNTLKILCRDAGTCSKQ